MLNLVKNLFVWKYRIRYDAFWQVYVPERTTALHLYWFDLSEGKIFTTRQEASEHLETFKRSDKADSWYGPLDMIEARREAKLVKLLCKPIERN